MKIISNGKVSGVPSWSVTTPGGTTYILYYKNGTWFRGDIGHMGRKYDNWSLIEVAGILS